MNILKPANLNDNLFSWIYVSNKSLLNSLKMIQYFKGKTQDNSYFINQGNRRMGQDQEEYWENIIS